MANTNRRALAALGGRKYRAVCRGFTLLEVLVSLLIFSFGVLGLVALQARTMQQGADSEDRARAALLANEMVSSMWMNQSATPSATVLASWQSRVEAALPSGHGDVGSADSDGAVPITITWKPPTRSGSGYKYLTQVVIQ